MVPNPNHEYLLSGTYYPALILMDSTGCADTLVDTVEVLPSPVADFSISDSLLCTGDTLYFTDLSTDAVSWFWDFGDGVTDTVQHPSHYFSGSGPHSAFLEVTGLNECRDTLMREDMVQYFDLTAAMNIDTVCQSLGAIFSDISSSDTTIVSWVWGFGDASGAITAVDTHTYADSGEYVVNLIVTDAVGCTDTIFDSLRVVQTTLAIPSIHVVTVTGNSADSVVFAPYLGLDFGHYAIYREDPPASGTYIWVADIFDPLDTTFIELGLSHLIQSYCYKVQTGG